MISLMKSSISSLFAAGAVAVLPTLIVARFTSQSPQSAGAAVNAEAQTEPQAQSPKVQTAQLENVADVAPPTTRPARIGGGLGGSFGGPGPLGGPGRNRPGGPFARRAEPPSQEEIQSAIEFFKENSPERMKYFQKLPDTTPARTAATAKLVQAYRPIQNFKESNSDLYALLVKQVQLRDQAFVLARNADEAGLRAKATEIVSVSIEARTKRLELLQKQLDEQQSQLAADKADLDSAAEKEVTSDKQDELRLLNRVDKIQKRFSHGQTMLDFDPSTDPLADAAPITSDTPDN